MSCRNPNVDGCMANDTQSYTETISNENSNDSVNLHNRLAAEDQIYMAQI